LSVDKAAVHLVQLASDMAEAADLLGSRQEFDLAVQAEEVAVKDWDLPLLAFHMVATAEEVLAAMG